MSAIPLTDPDGTVRGWACPACGKLYREDAGAEACRNDRPARRNTTLVERLRAGLPVWSAEGLGHG